MAERNIKKYYSQRGEDTWIMNHYDDFFSDDKKYRYLDIGAANALTNSNTRVFDELPNWSGVCFEPNPVYDSSYNETQRNRIKKAVTPDHTGKISFDLNGISEIGKIGGKDEVDCISVRDMFNELGSFDFLSIDVEGYEYDIVKEMLKFFEPKIIIAEYNTLGKYDFRLLNYVINKHSYELVFITEFNFIFFKK